VVKVIRNKNCECSFVYSEEFDSAEIASDPAAKGVVIDVKIKTIKTVFTTIKQKDDLVGQTKDSSAKDERSTGAKTSESSGVLS
jgi:hypothetical protein